MRFATTSGRFVTAATRNEAAALAAQYGFGDIVGVQPGAPKKERAMTVAQAVGIFAHAQDEPRAGQGWPRDARERQAAAVIAANPGCTDDLW